MNQLKKHAKRSIGLMNIFQKMMNFSKGGPCYDDDNELHIFSRVDSADECADDKNLPCDDDYNRGKKKKVIIIITIPTMKILNTRYVYGTSRRMNWNRNVIQFPNLKKRNFITNILIMTRTTLITYYWIADIVMTINYLTFFFERKIIITTTISTKKR